MREFFHPSLCRGAAVILKRLYHAHGSDGQVYEVHVYAEPASHANAHIERLAKVVLADGGELRILSKGHYEIVATGVKLEAGDPNAV
ncbi:MAG TPA: hypothetical protein VGC55_03760 [Dokdonella sp.]